MAHSSKISALLQLIRFDKPIGTLLLLWPTLWALWLAAGGVPELYLLAIFTLGTFLTRSAGCIVNDVADRNLDGAVSRTQARPLVTGSVTVGEALTLFVVLMLMAFALVLFTNTLTIQLSVIAVLLASAYPFIKRYSHLPQVVLGLAFSWSIPMAFAAQRAELPPALWLVYIGNLLWTVAYDTAYAMVDRDDDIKAGIKSSAILFGHHDRLMIGILQAGCLVALYLTGRAFELGIYYYGSLVVAATLFCYQHYLMRDRQRDQCFKAFLHNNWVGMSIFLGLAADFMAGTA
jgi:4-hydroxybenzoate polyprenyltransferase